jgi:hypothetical protein
MPGRRTTHSSSPKRFIIRPLIFAHIRVLKCVARIDAWL